MSVRLAVGRMRIVGRQRTPVLEVRLPCWVRDPRVNIPPLAGHLN